MMLQRLSRPLRGALVPLLLVTALSAERTAGQELSLSRALDLADRNAYQNRTRTEMAAAQQSKAALTMQGILPTLRFEGGWMQTSDPISAFGTLLRQRRITQADFDPQRLNYPGAATNHVGTIVLEQPVLNADIWLTRKSALTAASAAAASAEWTSASTRHNTVLSYYGAILAQLQVTTMASALRAADAHVTRAAQMEREGMVTHSDVLLAEVKRGDVQGMMAESHANSATALAALATALGNAVTDFTLPDSLPAPEQLLNVTNSLTRTLAVTERHDVAAAREYAEASLAELRRARFTQLPRINSFARYDWNSIESPFAGRKSWSVGVMASWTPFSGGSEIAQQRVARHDLRSAEAAAEGAEAEARLEVLRSREQLTAAVEKLQLAQLAVTQSADAHRLVSRRYAGGLATVVELLDAAATETRSRLSETRARFDLIAALSALLLHSGGDPGILRSLSPND